MVKLINQPAITFDDVLLRPGHSEVIPSQVSIKSFLTPQIPVNIPLLSSAMDTVTEARLAIRLAQEGGLGFIHKNMTVREQALEVKKVKSYESGIVREPITVTPDATLEALSKLSEAHAISGFPVLEHNQLVGIVTRRDLAFETDLSKPVREVMTTQDKLVTLPETGTQKEAVELLRAHRIEKILVIDDKWSLKGLITARDIQTSKNYPHACKDEKERLRVGAAVGVGVGTLERVEALVGVGVDVLVVDTAHGHSQTVLDRVREIKQTYPHLPLIGGNIATGGAALALYEAGADAVKVGVGPGSICTTRIVTGVGVPQVSAIFEVSHALKGKPVSVIADGGIRFSGDLAKALAAGADTVMVGSLLAGVEEAPGEVELYQGRTYKTYRGMGSLAAMAQKVGSSDRYFQHTSDAMKLVPEGVEGRVPYKGVLKQMSDQLMGGLRSCMGYVGAKTIKELQEKAEFVTISAAGMRESHAHDINITRQAPNYQIDSN